MKYKIYASGVHYLTVDDGDVSNMVKWLTEICGHINIKVEAVL